MKLVDQLSKIIIICIILIPLFLGAQQGTEMNLDNPQNISLEDMENNQWATPKSYFKVTIGSGLEAVLFQEVSGLDTETEPIEYRAGNEPVFSTNKMPGIVKSGNVTLKKGIFTKDNHFWNWYQEIKMNTIKRETVTIQLLDEEGNPTMTWTLANTWPTKITGTDLKSDSNKVAVETLELAHEVITINNDR